MIILGLDVQSYEAIMSSDDPRLDYLRKQITDVHNHAAKVSAALDKLVQDIDDGCILENYAAAAALRVLIDNWKAALRDGEVLGDLIEDVGRVIRILENDFAIKARQIK